MPVIFSNSWLGNTFSGATKWVQAHIDGIHVEPDGTVFTTSSFDPGLLECGVYKDGELIGQLRDNHLPVREPGAAIVADADHVYVGVRQRDPANKIKLVVRRYQKSKDFSPAIFTGSDWSYDRSMLIISENVNSRIVGLAIKDFKLYVAVEGENKIIVIDTTSMAINTIWFIPNPGNMAFDSAGFLWIIEKRVGATAGTVRQYNVETGTVPSLLSRITKLDNPTDICFNSNDELLIVENAIDPSVKVYVNSVFQFSYGVTGGSFGLPLDSANRFHGVTGIGVDSSNNYYLSSGTGVALSGADLRKVDPVANKFIWQVESSILGETVAGNDSVNGNIVYGVHERFQITGDFTRGKEWKKESLTLSPYSYPEDVRLFLNPVSVWHRIYQTREFVFMTDRAQSYIAGYKISPAAGSTLRPCLLFSPTRLDGSGNTAPYPPAQPTNVDYIWRDINGDGRFSSGEYVSIAKDSALGGWSIDSSMNIWKALRNNTIRRFTPQGLDASGNPIYNYSTTGTSTTTGSALITDLRRIEYVPETDTMFVCGFTTNNPAPYEDVRVIGSELLRVNSWSTGNRTQAWRTVLRVDRSREPSEILYPIAFTIVRGEHGFVAAVRTNEVFVYDLNSGALIAELLPDSVVGGKRRCGAIDSPNGISAFRQELSPWESRYVIFVQEPSYNKVLVYYFQP